MQSRSARLPDLEKVLLDEGILNQETLKEVRKIREKSSLRLEQIVMKKGFSDEESLLRIIASRYGFPFETKLDFKDHEEFQKIPLEFLRKSSIVPVSLKGNIIHAAVHDPSDLHSMDDLRLFLPGFRIQWTVVPESEINRIIQTYFDKAEHAAQQLMDGMGDEFTDLDSLNEDMDLSNEAPIIRMVNAILSAGVRERASDIHLEPYEKHLDVRYRIDGVLHRRLTPPKAAHAGLVSRIKIMANLNIAEARLPQDGRIKLKISGKDVDIRVSTIPTRYGERVVMRLLNKSDQTYSLKNLGLSAEMLEDLEKIIQEPNGIFLVTGPTGSGKTTSLYACLSDLNQEERNILTAEDPVEYEIDGISQMQMQEKVGLTFAAALRAMLRQDPDVIMVGEIRDQETARIAIQASLTGHLVLSTLHTNDAPSAVTRLVDMGVEPYLITSTVRAVLAQRLVRVICQSCKKPVKLSPKDAAAVGFKPGELPQGTVWEGGGCEQCGGTGYRGRTGIYELMKMDEEIQRAVIQGKDSEDLRRIAIERNMVTLTADGRRKVAQGITTIAEVMRVT